jgi:hypothetical protein
MLEMLEKALVEYHGDMLRACAECGTTPLYVRQWADAHEETAAKLHLAQLAGWAMLESVAYQRAVNGVEKAVWYQGEKVGTEIEYSDRLLSEMLKARVPGYGDQPVNHAMTINVAIMPRAETYQEWLEQRDTALSPEPLKLAKKSTCLPDI